jgi:ParB-like nuclease family protein
MSEFKPEIQMWDLGKIKSYGKNTKKHPKEQIDKLAAAMVEFGMDVPVVVDGNGVLIKGHGRKIAAEQLGLKELPVIVRTDLSPNQVKAARIADNKIAESEWDRDLLSLEMSALFDEGFNLSLTGFNADEIGDLFDIMISEGDTDPDDVMEPSVDSAPRPGDVWLLGNHRLCCDSTDAGVAVAVRSWQKHTGKDATLENDGRTFNEMCEVRYAGGGRMN